MNFLKNFYNEYLCLTLEDYPNIGIDIQINKILILLFLGLCVACLVISYNQSNVSLLLKKMIRAEAYGENNAKTMSELGLDKNKAVSTLILKGSGAISKIISVVGVKKQTYEEHLKAENIKKKAKRLSPEEKKNLLDSIKTPEIDLTQAKFYINEDKKAYAEHTFLTNNGSLIKTVLCCVLILTFGFALILAMPSLLSAVNSMLAS